MHSLSCCIKCSAIQSFPFSDQFSAIIPSPLYSPASSSRCSLDSLPGWWGEGKKGDTQEVASASLLIPPLEWITKWKWPRGSQVHPDQLTAASHSRRLPPTSSISEAAEPLAETQTASYTALRPPVVWIQPAAESSTEERRRCNVQRLNLSIYSSS